MDNTFETADSLGRRLAVIVARWQREPQIRDPGSKKRKEFENTSLESVVLQK